MNTQPRSDKPHIPLSRLRVMWQEAQAYAHNWGGAARDAFRQEVRFELYEAELAALRTERDELRQERDALRDIIDFMRRQTDSQVEELQQELAVQKSSWLAMMLEISKIADRANPEDNLWCDADAATLLEQFDPWLTLRELADTQAWEVVPDGAELEFASSGDNMGVYKPRKLIVRGSHRGVLVMARLSMRGEESYGHTVRWNEDWQLMRRKEST